MDSKALLILSHILTILIPIHGLLWLARRQELNRIRAMVRNYWYVKYKKHL
jgi:hypothetical protein